MKKVNSIKTQQNVVIKEEPKEKTKLLKRRASNNSDTSDFGGFDDGSLEIGQEKKARFSKALVANNIDALIAEEAEVKDIRRFFK